MDTNRFFEPIRIGCNLNVLRQSTNVETYNSLFNSDNERLCSICQSNYIDHQIIRKISHCGHFYHINCLDEWFENNVKCPECQYDLRESIHTTDTNTNTSNTNTSNTNESNIFTFLLNNQNQNQNQPTTQTLERLLQNIMNTSDTDINIEYYIPTIQHRQTQPTQPTQPNQPNQPISQTTNIPMDTTTNNRTSRNRRQRNNKKNQKEKIDYIMNYQKENIEKMNLFEKELELLRLQLEECKITKKYNPFNLFNYFWNK
jgi:hypothetical protein